MQDFISAIIIGTVKLIKYQESFQLVCELPVDGCLCFGPVDYSINYDKLSIILTEAKKGDMNIGLIQNLAKHRAALEFTTNFCRNHSAQIISVNSPRCFLL
jgi:hypothetical protein